MNSRRLNPTVSMLVCIWALSNSTGVLGEDRMSHRSASAAPAASAAAKGGQAPESISSDASSVKAPQEERHPLPRRVDRVKSSQVIKAGIEWNSPVRFGENCAFDLKVDLNQTFTTWTFDDHEYIRIEIQDHYKNLQTGFKFVDRADYVIQHHFATNTAFHAGIFWTVNLPKRGIVVRDTGTFTQDWSVPFPSPAVNLTGHHDVNSLPFGTLSYCGWAEGRFP